METTNITVMDNVYGEMRRFKMSQETFCVKLGISRKTYHNWEKKGDIPVLKLLECAKLFNCSLDYLVRDVNVKSTNDPS